jgi:hypothetical protein
MSPEIASALRLLYGDQVMVRPEFLGQIDSAGLKTAFRKRAMELHPDRAKILGKSSGELSELFMDVQSAYEQLKKILISSDEKVEDFRKTRRPAGRPAHGWAGTSGKNYWKAHIPQSRLLLGQFLYYAGLVTFNEMVSAITWQRQQRPNFGKIARMWKYLSSGQIEEIIAIRKAGEKMGDAAIRMGYLSFHERNAVIGFQKWLQRPIGEYFQKEGILAEKEIVHLIGLMKKHNARVERMKYL